MAKENSILEIALKAAQAQEESRAMDVANEVLNGNGIEFVSCGDSEISYINLGDTYDETICRDEETGELFISSWGGWLEETEAEYCQEEDVIRCGYCGEFTERGEGDWREVICQSCGHKVSGD